MIFIAETQDRRKFVEEVWRRFELSERIKGAGRILLKPNIVSSEPYPTTTHPETLEALIELLKAEGKEIAVADGPAFDAGDSERILRSSPIRSLCDKFGIPLVNLHKTPKRKMKAGDLVLEVHIFPLEFDFVFSLPVLKTHFVVGLTGALKNQFGILSNGERIKLHALERMKLRRIRDIHKAIVEVNLLMPPMFFFVDAIEVLIKAQEIRHGGERRKLGYMLAGDDPVALDVCGLELLRRVDAELSSRTPKDIPYLVLAAEAGLGSLTS